MFKRILTIVVLILSSMGTGWAEPKTFASPEDAVKAVVKAFDSDNEQQILAIFGPEARELLETADAAESAILRERIARAAEKSSQFQKEKNGTVTWVVGEEVWPFPIPLIHTKKGWRFDTEAGYDEVLRRRVGRNELAVIKLLRALAQAQMAYASRDYDEDGVFEFAQKLHCTPGKRDGLYWDASQGEPSPMESFADTVKEYLKRKTHDKTWMGYRLRLLTSQGPAAPGGKFNYIVNGNMILGYAVLAYPVDYRNTGIMSFMLNHYGQIRQADLGPDTVAVAEKMTVYNPGKNWSLLSD